jgi:sugar/nucleoside kinase (ribokinase family)
MTTNNAPACLCVGGIIIDDIVYPDGRTQMGVLGGGVSHAAAGVLIWGQRPGLFASAGRDLPAEAHRRLARDFDLRGLIVHDLPQARAWQLFEWDGKRTEVWRVEVLDPFIHEPLPDQLPPAYAGARAVYVLRDAAQLPLWRARFPAAALLWEPLQQIMVPGYGSEFRPALAGADIVSPNHLEATLVYGFDDPAALVRAMLDDGARIAVLRLGAEGSLVGARGQDALLRVPAVPVAQVVDQTGAGNTYCGGFLIGWVETGDLVAAACYGAVAASFALEVTGVADPPPDLPAQRERRYAWVRERVRALA